MAHRWGWGGVGVGLGWGWGGVGVMTSFGSWHRGWMLCIATLGDLLLHLHTDMFSWLWPGDGVGRDGCDNVLWLLAQRPDAMHCYPRRSSFTCTPT